MLTWKYSMLYIIVPYRDRKEHLSLFLPYMHSYLDMQGIEHEIYVIEQAGDELFNRGKLLNIGFNLSNKITSKDNNPVWFAFHDVDMLPITANYTYCEVPTHLVCNATQFPNGIPYEGYFGGVTLFNAHDFILINGYSNMYWGWGSEDDDLLQRIDKSELIAERRDGGVFQSLQHATCYTPEIANKNFEILQQKNDSSKEGLNTLEYGIISAKQINNRAFQYTVVI